MKYSKVIIDGHNLYHRNYHANQNLTFTIEDQEIVTGGVYGFLRSLNKIRREYLSDAGEVYIVFDNSHSKVEARRRLSPDYKNNRSTMPRSFFRGIEFLQLILLRYENNQYVVYRHKYEADDLVEPILEQFSEYDRTLLVSTDLDWARSIRQNVHWLSRDTLYDPVSFQQEFGFHPTHSSVSLYKTFKGDPVDGIKNPIPRFPFDSLVEIMSKFSDIYEVYGAVEDSPEKLATVSEKWIEKLRDPEVKDQMYINWELVSFRGAEYSEIEDAVYECAFSERKKASLRALYTSLGFTPETIDSRFEDTALDPLIGWDTL